VHLLEQYVRGYSRRAEAALSVPRRRGAMGRKLTSSAVSSCRGLALVPLTGVLMLTAPHHELSAGGGPSDATGVRAARFATETECWTALNKEAAPDVALSASSAADMRPEPDPRVRRLKAIFRAEGLPPALVWIAEVESAFDPRARSRAGAVGLFQLMPDTAHRFGLRTWPRDERRSVECSTRAAAQYLRYLHGRFGTWPLAIAAYNAGERTVARALRGRQDASFEAVAPRLPAETRSYVPRVLNLMADREGFEVVAR